MGEYSTGGYLVSSIIIISNICIKGPMIVLFYLLYFQSQCNIKSYIHVHNIWILPGFQVMHQLSCLSCCNGWNPNVQQHVKMCPLLQI